MSESLYIVLVCVGVFVAWLALVGIVSAVCAWAEGRVDNHAARKIARLVRGYEQEYGKPFPWEDTIGELKGLGIDTENLERLRGMAGSIKP